MAFVPAGLYVEDDRERALTFYTRRKVLACLFMIRGSGMHAMPGTVRVGTVALCRYRLIGINGKEDYTQEINELFPVMRRRNSRGVYGVNVEQENWGELQVLEWGEKFLK